MRVKSGDNIATLFWASEIQFTSEFFKINFNITLSAKLRDLSSDFFREDFYTKILYVFLVSLVHATYSRTLILFTDKLKLSLCLTN
jgi:hypothetical protein